MTRSHLSGSQRREESIFSGALRLPPAERPRFVAQACGRETRLRERVEALLHAHAVAGDFLELPPALPRNAGPHATGSDRGSGPSRSGLVPRRFGRIPVGGDEDNQK